MTENEKAQIKAELDELWAEMAKPRPKPKVVVNDGIAVRDADVQVSPRDPNYRGDDGRVQVRRPEYVTINMWAWEQQMAERAEARRRRRDLDPYKLGLYGPVEDE